MTLIFGYKITLIRTGWMCANYCDTASSNLASSYFFTYQTVFCKFTAQPLIKSVVCDSFLFVFCYQIGNGFATHCVAN